jgi:hypothetical protein
MNELFLGTPNYDDAKIEGGIHAFDDVIRPDLSKAELGDSPVPSEEGLQQYTEFLESYGFESQEEEDIIAEAT